MTQQLVWLIPGLPLFAFMLLVLAGDRLPPAAVTAVARTAAAGSALVAAVVIGVYLALPPAGGAVLQSLGQWVDAGGLSARVALRLDPLSLVPIAVVTGLAALIQSGPVADDGRHDRAWLSLLAAGLLILVLAENLLLAYLGWELAGLAGYLLLRPGTDRTAAGSMALLVSRVGAMAVLVALLLLFSELGTLHLPTLLARAGAAWSAGEPLATAATALLAGGLLVRAAHVPLQARLQRAPAASALVHGALPGAAVVYLIARMHGLFELAPSVQAALAVLGGITLIAAAGYALLERDLLRLLGHAAVSQTGVMMLALGLSAPVAAVFQSMTYACASALLFLAAGALVAAGGGERDLSRLGGLGRRLPGVALAFGVGAGSLAALPLVAAGFYSQMAVLQAASGGGPLALAVVLLGILLTALYAFRAVFVLLRGGRPAPAPPGRQPNRVQSGVLVVLAALALGGGVVGMPVPLGGWQPLPQWLHYVLPAADTSGAGASLGAVGLMLAAAAASLAGVALAWRLSRHGAPRAGDSRTWLRVQAASDLFASGVRRVARPLAAVVRAGAGDVADGLDRRLAAMARWGHGHLDDSQSGRLRAYAAGMVGGVIVLIGIVVLS